MAQKWTFITTVKIHNPQDLGWVLPRIRLEMDGLECYSVQTSTHAAVVSEFHLQPGEDIQFVILTRPQSIQPHCYGCLSHANDFAYQTSPLSL
jgi:hypothetical protein